MIFRRRAYILASFLLMTFMSLRAQVTVEMKIDTVLIRIGEQTMMHCLVSMDKDSHCTFPEYGDTIVTGVEMMESSDVREELLNNGERKLLTKDYLITSFDSGHYYLPPMEVDVDGKTYKSRESLSLKVMTVDVDLEHPETFCGPKDVLDVPFVWEDWVLVFWMAVLLIPCVALTVYLYIRLKDNKPIIKKIHIKPPLPPHQKAISQINAIKVEKQWSQEDSKEYYTKLTDALRQYIKERYGFNATEMTSSEIISQLLTEQDEQAIAELRQLFETADLVKFAKYYTLLNENDRNLVSAVDFINQTKQEVDPATLNKKQELTVEEKRSKEERTILKVSIAILAILSCSMLALICHGLYRLCF